MNKKQTIIISEVNKAITIINNKVHEFDQKFFNEQGVLNENSSRANKVLEIGVYLGSTGQTITIDSELKPKVLLFLKSLRSHYTKKLKDIDVEQICEELFSAEDSVTVEATKKKYEECE